MSRSQAEQSSTNYKEAFALFDKRGKGRVQLESLGDLLRACGQNPTLAEISDLEKAVGDDCTNTWTPHCPIINDANSMSTSRLRIVYQGAQPSRRFSGTRGIGGLLPWLPGVRQGSDWIHRSGTVEIQYANAALGPRILLRSSNPAAVLTNLGEKMSEDEVDELLKATDTSSGEINYAGRQFICTLSWWIRANWMRR